MATSSGRVDDFVKDYLIYRGLSTTLRTLELELKNEKEKGFRVDKIVDQLQAYVSTYDLANLRDYWNFLNSRLFSRLEQRYMTSVRKLEVGLLKYYLVNASQNNKQEKILEFFDRMTELLQTQSEFKEWFAFPFVRSPRDNSHFSTYFSQQWQDTFFLSLHNFLSVILQAMPGPALVNFEAEQRQLKQLQTENERLKFQLKSLGEKPDVDGSTYRGDNLMSDRSDMDLVYDFSSLGEETAIQEPASKSPRKFPFTSSPLGIGKKADKSVQPVKKRDDQIRMGSMVTKDNKSGSKSSRLLPVITRQKKPTKSGTNGQSLVQDSQANQISDIATNQISDMAANQMSDMAANQNAAESLAANHRLKRLEEAKMKRKELLEGSPDKTKNKEDRHSSSANRQESPVTYTRSVSESAGSGRSSPRATYRHSSKSISESKPSSIASTSEAQVPAIAMDTVSPLATATVATMLGTVVSEKARELQTFPIAGSQSDICEPEVKETIEEKPFLLLSQEDYTEHRSAISYSRFSNSGQYIASVDVDGVVKVWTWSPELTTAATVMSKSAFLSLEWASKSDRWLLLGNRSGNIRLFDVKEMKSFYEASADPSFPRIIGICSSPASPTFACAATTGRGRTGSIGTDTGPSKDNKIGKLTLWDLKTMKSDRTLPLDPGPVCINTSSFNHNGQLLIAGGVDGYMRLFDVSKLKCVSKWPAHWGEIKQVLFSSDYTSCYSLGLDGTMYEWSMHKMGEKLRDLPLHQGAVPKFLPQDGATSCNKEEPSGRLLAVDSDGKYLLGFDGSGIEIYRVVKEEPGLLPFMKFKGHKSSSLVTTVDWSPNIDTKICLTGHLDGKVVVTTLLSQ